jgi:ubiquinone/menaquinone biosynthesis C-methylase UbiE
MKKLIVIIFFLIFLFLNILYGDRDQRQQPLLVMDKIGVKKGMVIGVAGAGRGYFTFHMSKRVGEEGRIYANEINENHLRYIRRKCRREGITNVTTILGRMRNPQFPEGKMDMVFMCYVFHDLAAPVAFLKNIKKSLKPGATVVILDQDPGKTGDHHFYTKEVLLEKVRKADYRVVRIEDFHYQDNIYICKPTLE